MAVFVFVLALILAIVGCGGLIASVDLLPTEIGILYAGCGVIALSASFVVAAIGALIVRIGSLTFERTREFIEPGAVMPDAPSMETPEPPAHAEPLVEEQDPSAETESRPSEDDDPLNENRTGRLPTLHEMEEAIAHPESPPTLVGRYTAGGANYMIFSDGTIEAETSQGQFRFASMGDFKAFIAENKE